MSSPVDLRISILANYRYILIGEQYGQQRIQTK
jgi:hypothetical protein